MTVMQGVRVTVAAVGRGYPKTAVTTVTAVTPKDGHPPKERRNPPMPYAILRFQKRKAGGVAACERHNERKKEAYKSNPDIDMERSKNNYHLIAPPKYTYKKEINRMVAEAGCRTRKDSVMMVETLIPTLYLLLKQWYLMTMGSQSSNAQQRLRQWNTS